MPDMSPAVRLLEETLSFEIVKQTIVDGEVVESSAVRPTLYFEGALQPVDPRELLVKPEGQRKFKHWTLTTDMVLVVDWIIKDERGVQYRVMASSDWNEAGFHQYRLIEGTGL